MATDTYSVHEYVDATVQYLDMVWSGWMIGNGYAEPYVWTVYLANEQVHDSQCTTPEGVRVVMTAYDQNAYFCPDDAACRTGSCTKAPSSSR